MTVYPAPPADPPLAESLCILAGLLVLSLVTTAIVLRRWALIRDALPVLAFAVVLISFGVHRIHSRNHGRWAALKAELLDYQAVASTYEGRHGRVLSQDDADRFFSIHPSRLFSLGGLDVHITYLWYHQPGRVAIEWGKGGTAAFDLETMVCVYSD